MVCPGTDKVEVFGGRSFGSAGIEGLANGLEL